MKVQPWFERGLAMFDFKSKYTVKHFLLYLFFLNQINIDYNETGLRTIYRNLFWSKL